MSLGTPAPWNSVAEGYDRLVRPALSNFAEQALALTSVGPESRILDVATGPGTLPLLAAGLVGHVVGVDFSPEMLRLCRDNTAGLGNVRVEHADGQALRFDNEFDAAFSLFGLIFFPDRAAGFTGLHRALRPGGSAVVSAWPPPERSSAMVRAIAACGAAFPDAPSPAPDANPLNNADTLRAELTAAGFVDIDVVEATFAFTTPVDALWQSIAEGFAPIVHARRTMPDGVWANAEARGLRWLHANHDPTETLSYAALLGHGRKP